MPRNIPCRGKNNKFKHTVFGLTVFIACKRRRRKCVWKTNSTICLRCTRLNVDCSPFDEFDCENDDDDEIGTIDGSKEMETWFEQIRILENELANLEVALRSSSVWSLSRVKGSNSGSNDERGSMSSLFSVQSKDLKLAATFRRPADFDRADLLAHYCQPFNPAWKFSVVNGALRVETNIRTFTELFQLSQASTRYLSPFSDLFQKASVIFDSSSVHTVSAALRLITRYRSKQPRRAPIMMGLPILNDYKPVIDKLVYLYLELYNSWIPLLHAPSFFRHYKSLKDPLTSPIVLAICINMMASFRKVPDYSAMEKRLIADFLYHKCHDLFLDMFDDPSRRLETLMTISFLMQYLISVRLQFTDARRIGTMALMICAEIESSRLFDSFSDIERVMFFRHAHNIDAHMQVINMLLNCNLEAPKPRCKEMEYVEDESDIIKENIIALNCIMRLSNSPLVATALPQVRRIISGEPGELNIDLIIRFEALIREWWAKLPDNLRICEDPYDRNIPEYIDSVGKETAILVAGYVHCITLSIHANLLNPRMCKESAYEDNILRLIQQNAMEVTLRSCDVLLATLARWIKVDLTRKLSKFGV
ncbi:hypothetical protein BX666DRAFT_2009970 [Dichotomocladium elegans]|nr:hypothetical protein BX666DRAFT_2009970 [Dichotomocladium elegans]